MSKKKREQDDNVREAREVRALDFIAHLERIDEDNARLVDEMGTNAAQRALAVERLNEFEIRVVSIDGDGGAVAVSFEVPPEGAPFSELEILDRGNRAVAVVQLSTEGLRSLGEWIVQHLGTD